MCGHHVVIERRPRVLVITQVYRPEPNFITADVAEMLAGYAEVTTVTAHPNYPEGRFRSGTSWWRPVRSVEGGVRVWRLPFLPYQGRSALRRGAAYLSFMIGAVLWMPIVARRTDLVWIYHGPFTAAPAAILIKWLTGARLVVTVADLWPEAFLAAGVARRGPVLRWLFAYRRWVNRHADLIIGSTEGTVAAFAREGVPAERLRYVPVWVEGASAPSPDTPAGTEGPARIVYAGQLGPAQALETVIRGAALLEADGADVQIDLYGTGSSEASLRQLATELNARSVRFHGRVPPAQAFAVSARAFAQIVSLQRSPLFAMVVPSKISFCCAAAAPVLYALEGEPAGMLAASGGGVAYDSSDPRSFAAAVEELLRRSPDDRRMMRVNLREYYEKYLARQKLLRRYEDILREVMA